MSEPIYRKHDLQLLERWTRSGRCLLIAVDVRFTSTITISGVSGRSISCLQITGEVRFRTYRSSTLNPRIPDPRAAP